MFWIYQGSISRKYQGKLRWLLELYEDWYAVSLAFIAENKNIILNGACHVQNLNQLWYKMDSLTRKLVIFSLLKIHIYLFWLFPLIFFFSITLTWKMSCHIWSNASNIINYEINVVVYILRYYVIRHDCLVLYSSFDFSLYDCFEFKSLIKILQWVFSTLNTVIKWLVLINALAGSGTAKLAVQLKVRLCQILTRSSKILGKWNESMYLTFLGSNKLIEAVC